MSNAITPEIYTIEKLLDETLVIPDYQRPYRWQESHIRQLIDDLKVYSLSNCEEYRIGTVVLYQPKDRADLEIVDGQQRTLTLCLILAAINDKIKSTVLPEILTSLTLTHPESQNQAKHNSAFIKQCFEQYDLKELSKLFDFILKSCSVVVVKLNDLGEAFQFFDSQNARGKALEPHDLLKAFHLREMKNDLEQRKLSTIEHWEEEASAGGQLKGIFSDYLYRLRQWGKGNEGRYFTSADLDVFKGVNIEDANLPPYLQLALRAHVFTNNYNQATDRLADKNQLAYPHQVNQVILNGSRFFEYIAHYIEQRKQLLAHSDLQQYFKGYSGSGRSGDIYTRNLFLAAVLIYKDKFGDSNFSQVVHLCFCWAYKLRMERPRVQFASVDNYAKSEWSLIRLIENAVTENQVLRFAVNKNEELVRTNKTKGLKELHMLYLGRELSND